MAQAIIAVVIIISASSVQAYSLGSDNTILINKSHPLQPLDYIPPSLVVPPVLLAEPVGSQETLLAPAPAKNLEHLFKAARNDDIILVLTSGYRPYEDQVALYNIAARQNKVTADESIARPGFSEHQTGLAADVTVSNYFCVTQGCFALSHAAAWLDQNAYKYGFIVRYPLDKTASTGYEYEPWHLRYVGSSLAARLHQRGETLEEFYGLP